MVGESVDDGVMELVLSRADWWPFVEEDAAALVVA